jgi:rhodanese-related sulfurtransferase
MTKMSSPLKSSIEPKILAARLAERRGGILLDVRTPAEFNAAHIAGARLRPLADLRPRLFAEQFGSKGPIYVICQSGSRARKAIEALQQAGMDRCILAEGGMDAWTQAGLSVERAKSGGLSIMRQVQIVIGSAAFAGAVLALFVDFRFALIPLMSGAGLLFAGISGWCGLAILLAKAPWNRLPASSESACCTSTGGAR